MAAVVKFYPGSQGVGMIKVGGERPKDITVSDEKFESLDAQGLSGFVKVKGKKSGSSKERTFAIRVCDISDIEYI